MERASRGRLPRGRPACWAHFLKRPAPRTTRPDGQTADAYHPAPIFSKNRSCYHAALALPNGRNRSWFQPTVRKFAFAQGTTYGYSARIQTLMSVIYEVLAEPPSP